MLSPLFRSELFHILEWSWNLLYGPDWKEIIIPDVQSILLERWAESETRDKNNGKEARVCVPGCVCPGVCARVCARVCAPLFPPNQVS